MPGRIFNLTKCWLLLSFVAAALVVAGCGGGGPFGGGGIIKWGPGWSPTSVASSGDEVVVFVGTRQGEVLALSAKENGSLIWRFAPGKLKEGSGRELRLGGVYGMPAVGEEFVYVGDKGDKDGKNGRLYALRKERDSGSGIQRQKGEWVKPPTEGAMGGIVGGPALAEAEGLVLVGSHDGSLYAFHTTGDRAGNMAWSFPTDRQIWSTPVVEDGAVYFGSMDRHVYAVSLEEGLNPASRLLWKYKTGGAVVSKPLLLDKMLIVGSFDKKVYALDRATGAFLWSFEGDNWFWAGAVSDGNSIFASSMGGTVYALEKTGVQVWLPPFEAETPIVSTPVVVGDNLLVATDGGNLHLLSARTGEELEVFKDLSGKAVKAPLSVGGTMVFVGIEDSTVRGVDVDRWEELWQVSTKR